MLVRFAPLPENCAAVMMPVVLILISSGKLVAVVAVPVKSPVIVVKVGLSVSVIVPPIPDAVAVRLPLTKFKSQLDLLLCWLDLLHLQRMKLR
jgi:hypothetical protein